MRISNKRSRWNLLRRKKNANILESELPTQLLRDPFLLDYVKIEAYLAVVLGIRPSSLITIPAEFPNKDLYGKQIDALCREDLRILKNAGVADKPVLIQRLKEKIRKSFKQVVIASKAYQTHVKWAKQLFLQSYQVEVRPSIHEFYLFKDSHVERKLRRLVEVRKIAKKTALTDSPKVHAQRLNLVYGEEHSYDFLNSMGELLGYPSCCVQSYIEDRLQKKASVEIRASKQIEELRNNGEKPYTFAFFARNFFPCTPKCKKANAVGKSISAQLMDFSPKLADLHLDCLKKNVATIENYPESITRCKENLEKRAF